MKMLYPESNVIHCSRNSKDTCLSIYKHLFLSDWKWCYKTNELTNYYKLYVSLMKFWKENLNKFIKPLKYISCKHTGTLKLPTTGMQAILE